MVSAVVFDLDGVVYRGARRIPGVVAEISRLQKEIPVLFLTNNATKSRLDYVRYLARFGIRAKIQDVMTSSFGCAEYILENFGTGKRVCCIGESGFQHELKYEARAKLVGSKADIVACGLDRQINYEKLDSALQCLNAGAKFILANSDATWPREDGVSPGSGAIAASLIYASGRRPDIVIGKPSTYLIRKLLEMHGVKARDAAFVGDRLDIDIRMARRMGMKSVLVLTGIAKRSDIAHAPLSDKPDIVIESAAKVGRALGL